jgi:Tfp pilus assembly protein PilF
MKRISFLLLILWAGLGFLSASAQTDKLPIAVLDLDAKGVEPSVAGVITENVRYEFGKRKDLFDLVAREKMVQLAKEKAFQLTGCTDVSCAVQIGKALNVKKMVIGSVTRLGNKYALFLKTVDVEAERVECSEKEDAGTDVEQTDKVVSDVVKHLSGCMIVEGLLDEVPKNLEPRGLGGIPPLGMYLRAQGKVDKVATACLEATRLNPGYAKGYSLLGLASFVSIKLVEAKQAYRDAIRLNPDDAESHYMLALVLRVQELPGQTGEVEKELREAIRLKPDFAEAYVILGTCLSERADSGAVKAFEEAVRLKPYLIQAHDNLWDEYQSRQGKTDGVIWRYKYTLQDSKFSSPQEKSTATFGLATYYDKTGKKQEARMYWKKVLELPDVPSDVVEAIKERLTRQD